jgi:hypothetical protein
VDLEQWTAASPVLQSLTTGLHGRLQRFRRKQEVSRINLCPCAPHHRVGPGRQNALGQVLCPAPPRLLLSQCVEFKDGFLLRSTYDSAAEVAARRASHGRRPGERSRNGLRQRDFRPRLRNTD